MCPCVAWFARSRPGPGFVTSSSCGAAGFLLQTHPVSDRPPFRADLARSVRLFRAIGSALRLPLATGAVDVCFSSNVLEHVGDWQAMLAEMVRVTRPGGVIFV